MLSIYSHADAVARSELGIPGVREVAEMTPDQIMDGIERVLFSVAVSSLASFHFSNPLRRCTLGRYLGYPATGSFLLQSSILDGEGFSYDVPSRTSGNQIYIAELDRIALQVGDERLH